MKPFLIWFLLITFFLITRLYKLENLPLFSDEAYAVARAWELEKTGELLGMIKYTTQPIFIWLIGLFQFLPFGTVVNGRLASGVFGLGTALLVAKLAGRWIGGRAEIPAFILMTILPFSVFYDRTILFESTTLFFMLLSLIFPVATGLAILTKQTGWLILPLVLALGRRSLKGRVVKVLIGILAVMAIWYLAMGSYSLIIETMFGKTAAPISTSANFKNNLLRSKLWLIDYLTWPVIWLSFFGGLTAFFEAFRKKQITPILMLAGWVLGIFLFINKTAVIFYPRYLYPIVLGAILLAVKGWNELTNRHSESPVGGRRISTGSFSAYRRIRMTVATAVGLLVLIPSLISSWKIVMTPVSSDIPREDRFQFFEDWTSGVGSKEIADEIAKISNGKDVNIYLEEENSYFITLKSDLRLKNAEVGVADWLVDPLTEIPEEILSTGRLSVFVRNRYPDIPVDWPVKLVVEVPKTDFRSVYLYRIVK